MTAPAISLVIPAHNEERLLPRLLASVERARDAYRAGGDQVEVIVANDSSTDRTGDLARELGARVVEVSARNIGAARNAGAAAAIGAIIAFVDADNQVHPETFNEIERQLARPDIIAGATGATMERWSLGIRLAYAVASAAVWITNVDTGVVFCRREDFAAIHGYRESMRYAEDVMFLLDLWGLGRTRGQRLVRARRAKIIFSARKFDQFGDWHYLAMIFAAPVIAPFRRLRERFADTYWYNESR